MFFVVLFWFSYHTFDFGWNNKKLSIRNEIKSLIYFQTPLFLIKEALTLEMLNVQCSYVVSIDRLFYLSIQLYRFASVNFCRCGEEVTYPITAFYLIFIFYFHYIICGYCLHPSVLKL
jgi:hypothetical protein